METKMALNLQDGEMESLWSKYVKQQSRGENTYTILIKDRKANSTRWVNVWVEKNLVENYTLEACYDNLHWSTV